MTERSSVTRRGFLRGATGTAAIAGASGAAVAQEEGGGATHRVDMTDGLVFEPEEVTVAPGDTVVWDNVGSVGHSVTAYEDDIPSEATYFASGGFDTEEAARGGYPEGDIPGGETYEHTFETTGTYEYFCIPHEAAGMVGTIAVQEGGGGGGGGGDAGGGAPSIPDAAKTLGLGLFGAMLASLGLAYVLLKYGGNPDALEE